MCASFSLHMAGAVTLHLTGMLLLPGWGHFRPVLMSGGSNGSSPRLVFLLVLRVPSWLGLEVTFLRPLLRSVCLFPGSAPIVAS